VGSADAIGYLAPLVSVYAPRAAVAWRGATPEARLNTEGMENIGFKARSACAWGLRREALKVGIQRDALWQRKLWPSVAASGFGLAGLLRGWKFEMRPSFL